MADQHGAPRRPGLIPDDIPGDDIEGDAFADRHAPVDITGGVDTNADGRPDTLVTDDGFDLIVHTDRDGDGFADHVLRIGPDGGVREVAPRSPAGAVIEGVLDGADTGFEP